MTHSSLDLMIFAIAVVAIPVQSVLAGRRLGGRSANGRDLRGRYWQVIARNIFLSIFLVVIWRYEGRSLSALGLDIPIGRRGQIGFLVDAVLAVFYIYNLLVRKLSPERVEQARRRLDTLRIVPHTRGEFLLFPFVAIAGGIFEELLYRGFLIWLASPLFGVWGAVLGSSLVFGAGHAYQSAMDVLRTTLIGAVFAIGFVLTHSLWWLIVAHIMVNIFGALFALRLDRYAPEPAHP